MRQESKSFVVVVALISGLVGSIIGGFSTFVGSWYQTRYQPEYAIQAREKYEKNIQHRDVQIARLKERVQKLRSSENEQDAKISEITAQVRNLKAQAARKIAALQNKIRTNAEQHKRNQAKLKRAEARQLPERFVVQHNKDYTVIAEADAKGHAHGMGIYFTNDKDGEKIAYAGEFQNGRLKGYGVWKQKNLVLLGQNTRGVFSGPGIRKTGQKTYLAELKDSLPDGATLSCLQNSKDITLWKNGQQIDSCSARICDSAGNSIAFSRIVNNKTYGYLFSICNNSFILMENPHNSDSQLLICDTGKRLLAAKVGRSSTRLNVHEVLPMWKPKRQSARYRTPGF